MLVIGLAVGAGAAAGRFNAVDALAYWQAGTSHSLYPQAWSDVAQGYLFYPPPVAQLSTLLQPVGWNVFVVFLMTATFGAFWYCARGWSIPLVLIGIPYFLGVGPSAPATFLSYALLGNLQWVLAALTIVALRHPAVWSIELLTKVTSAIGWWWHVLRGEWRAAMVGAGASAAVIAVSFILSPAVWLDFVAFMARNYSATNGPMQTFAVPFLVRLPSAFLLVAWGARTNRAWVVSAACGWAMPAVYGLGFLPFWVAAYRLRTISVESGPEVTRPRGRLCDVDKSAHERAVGCDSSVARH